MTVEFESRVNLAPKTQSFCYTKLPLLIIHRLLKAREDIFSGKKNQLYDNPILLALQDYGENNCLLHSVDSAILSPCPHGPGDTALQRCAMCKGMKTRRALIQTS